MFLAPDLKKGADDRRTLNLGLLETSGPAFNLEIFDLLVASRKCHGAESVSRTLEKIITTRTNSRQSGSVTNGRRSEAQVSSNFSSQMRRSCAFQQDLYPGYCQGFPLPVSLPSMQTSRATTKQASSEHANVRHPGSYERLFTTVDGILNLMISNKKGEPRSNLEEKLGEIFRLRNPRYKSVRV